MLRLILAIFGWILGILGYFGEFFSGIPVYHCPRLADSVLTLPVQKDTLIKTLNNGNRTQWIRIRVWLQTELDDRKFCYQFIAYYNYNKICDILGFLKSKHKKFQEPFLLAVKKKKKKHLSARGKDKTRLPMPNLPLSHWSRICLICVPRRQLTFPFCY